MRPQSFRAIGTVSLPFLLACSGNAPGNGTGAGGSGGGAGSAGVGGEAGDGRLFVPEGLPNTPNDEVGGALTLIAFTLAKGPTRPELYAAVRNDAQTPVCEAGMTTDFFDRTDQLVTTAGVGLLSGRFYRLDETTVLTCIDPGQIAMAAATNLPEDLVIEDLAYLKHRLPNFMLGGITPLAPLTVSDVEVATTGAGTVYRGTLTNPLEVTVSTPKVTIFPVNRVGRPLGVATSSSAADIPPGGSWSFETSAVNEPGTGYVAYPSAAIGN